MKGCKPTDMAQVGTLDRATLKDNFRKDLRKRVENPKRDERKCILKLISNINRWSILHIIIIICNFRKIIGIVIFVF